MTKGERKSSGSEPTITDVMGVVQDLTEAVQTGFGKMEERFEKVESGVRALQTGQESLTERMGDIHRRIINLEHRVEDAHELLADITSAEEKDAEATLNHERRISHLEKLGGIKSIPTKHLVGLK